jgi:hypothetical protein
MTNRGYSLEMICADLLAGAHLDNGNPEILLNSISRYYKFFARRTAAGFPREPAGESIVTECSGKTLRLRPGSGTVRASCI